MLKGDETTNFSATGELDKEAMETFQKLFDKKREDLKAIGKFDSNALDDSQLKFSVE